LNYESTVESVEKERNHGKKPGNPTTCYRDEWKVRVWELPPSFMAFSLEEPRSLLRSSSLAERIVYGGGSGASTPHIPNSFMGKYIFQHPPVKNGRQ
jgi:hypothetical protein